MNALDVKNYTLTVKINDRYVNSELGIHILNSANKTEDYNFAVNLNENEFISKLNIFGGKTTFGNVYEKDQAKKILKKAKESGENTALPRGSKTMSNTVLALLADVL